MIQKIKTEWNAVVGVPTPSHPTLISKEQAELMCRLIKEEVEELEEAIQHIGYGDDKETIFAIADALVDISYLTLGTASQFGFTEIWEKLLEEVHRSNKTKLTDGELKKREDGKILKPSTYLPPDFSNIIN